MVLPQDDIGHDDCYEEEPVNLSFQLTLQPTVAVHFGTKPTFACWNSNICPLLQSGMRERSILQFFVLQASFGYILKVIMTVCLCRFIRA